MRYTRFALGAAFLSAVAGRFSIWGENTTPDSFKHFMEYTAKVNSFMPAFTIPFLAWAATIAETFLGITLILGIWLRFVALAAAGLAGSVWHRHGDFVGHQNAARLFSVFCVRRSVVVSHMPDSKGRR